MPDTLETYRAVTPYLVVPDADGEMKFVEAAFGATQKMCQRNPDGAIMHAEILIGDCMVMLGQANQQWKAVSGNLFLWAPNVDDLYQKALAAGATSLRPPEDMPYGHRTAGVLDSCGITWWLGSPVKG